VHPRARPTNAFQRLPGFTLSVRFSWGTRARRERPTLPDYTVLSVCLLDAEDRA
jgi:hypothetical protein